MVLALIHQGQTHLSLPLDSFLASLATQQPNFEGTVPSLPLSLWLQLSSSTRELVLRYCASKLMSKMQRMLILPYFQTMSILIITYSYDCTDRCAHLFLFLIHYILFLSIPNMFYSQKNRGSHLEKFTCRRTQLPTEDNLLIWSQLSFPGFKGCI